MYKIFFGIWMLVLAVWVFGLTWHPFGKPTEDWTVICLTISIVLSVSTLYTLYEEEEIICKKK